MRILLATTNPHKLHEIRAVMDDPAIELISLDALSQSIAEPVEDGDTFQANAIKKARHYAQAAGMLCLADDSGLEVDALAGDPGVRSARYAGVQGPRRQVDLANNRLLLENLREVPIEKRTARFVCAMALAAPPAPDPKHLAPAFANLYDTPLTVRGTIEGRILTVSEAADPAAPQRGRGVHGFGYDPLFLVSELGKTTAEIDPAHKNAISHRGQAARAMFTQLKERGWIKAS
jgi:XTP/dITP diphosphohydrolase